MFNYDPKVYNTNSAKEIVPVVLKLLQPKSVIDVGCGIGTWLNVFASEGLADFVGVDGEYVDRTHLQISADKFIQADLNQQFKLNRKFDLVISLEVAEHLDGKSADTFIGTLTGLGDTILFSAAIPGQGGQDHINEQWPEYWVRKFHENGFVYEDIFREKIWHNTQVEWWYKQNIFLFRRSKKNETSLRKEEKLNLVHPENYLKKLEALDKLDRRVSDLQAHMNDIKEGRKGLKFAFSVLIKTIKRKLR